MSERTFAGVPVELSREIPKGVVHVTLADGGVVTFITNESGEVVREYVTNADGSAEELSLGTP